MKDVGESASFIVQQGIGGNNPAINGPGQISPRFSLWHIDEAAQTAGLRPATNMGSM